jgi:plastocyanin
MVKLMACLAVGAAALAVSACGGNSYSSSSSSTSAAATGSSTAKSSGPAYGYSAPPKQSAATGAGGAPGTVTMQDDLFQPKTITGKAGSSVKLTVKNAGAHDHTFTIDSQSSVDANVAPGQSATVTVKIPSSGSVAFYCRYHKALGMTGVIAAG